MATHLSSAAAAEPAEELFAVPMVAALAETYRQTVSKAGLHAYAIGLSDLSPAAVATGCRRALLTCKFMPTISELRELCGVCSEKSRAEIAWQFVSHAVVRLGAYRSPEFDDPAIAATIHNLGGWVAICGQPASEFDVHTRREFLKTYETMRRSGVASAEPLVGLYEQANSMRGLSVDTRQRITTGYTLHHTYLGSL